MFQAGKLGMMMDGNYLTAILADTAAMDTNLGTLAGAVSGSAACGDVERRLSASSSSCANSSSSSARLLAATALATAS